MQKLISKDFEVQRFPKPRSKSDPKFLENEKRLTLTN